MIVAIKKNFEYLISKLLIKLNKCKMELVIERENEFREHILNLLRGLNRDEQALPVSPPPTPDNQINEVPEVTLDCYYLNGFINIKCDNSSFQDIQQAVRALNKSRQSQREFKQRESGRVNRARKPNIVFRMVQ